MIGLTHAQSRGQAVVVFPRPYTPPTHAHTLTHTAIYTDVVGVSMIGDTTTTTTIPTDPPTTAVQTNKTTPTQSIFVI